MRHALPLTLSLALAAGGCARIAGSPLNPLNWFGGGQPVIAEADPVATAAPSLIPEDAITQVVDQRVPLSQVTELRVERAASGAIVRATGLAPGPGYFNAELVRVGLEGGTLVYDFRAETPPDAVAGGTAAQRRITAADDIARDELAAIRAVRVRTAGNSLQASR